jgi:hypothetical protein
MATQPDPPPVNPTEHHGCADIVEHRYYGHGLYYVARDGQSSYNLLSSGITGITRPETDVLEALLKYVQDRLKNPWDTDGG